MWAIMIGYLITHNIFKLISRKSILFAIIVSSLAVSTYGALFFSGYFSYSYYDTLQGEVSNVCISLSPTSTPEEVNELLDSIIPISSEDVISVTVSDGAINNDYLPGNRIPVIGKYSKTEKAQLLLGRYFQEGEDCPVVLLSESCASTLDVPDMPLSTYLNLEDVQYEVIGILFNSDSAYILPVDYYIDHYPVSLINISFGRQLTSDCINDILSREHVENVEYTQVSSPFLSTDFLPSLIQIILIYCFTFINIILVIQLWQQESLEQYKVYYYLGASQNTIRVTAFFQILCISVFGVLIGYVLFLITLPILSRQEIVYMSLFDCSFLAVGIVIIIMLFSVRYCKKLVDGLCRFRLGG